MALESKVDFLAVVEHRLIPARVRSEWARLREKGLATIWAACFSGLPSCWSCWCCRVVSVRGATVALPTFATAQFRRFFGCGRAI